MPPIIQYTKGSKAPLLCVLFALGITILAALWIDHLLHDFYADTASFAPGTEIRPMGLTMALGLGWTASILVGGGLALIGCVLALKERRWLIAVIAALTMAVTWLPMTLSNRGFAYVLNVRKLVLEE